MTANKKQMYSDVEFITQIRPYRNHKNLASLEKVRNYIIQEFEKCGLEVEEQKWTVKKSWPNSDAEYANVIASYNKAKTKRLIVGAHYDVCGNTPGADDNASAVAGLLETARLVMENKPEIDYRIDFVAYCLEEPPYFNTNEMGSFIHAKSLWSINAEVMGMICYEMIGYFSKQAFLDKHRVTVGELADTIPATGDFIMVVGNEDYREFNDKFYDLMMDSDTNIGVELVNLPPFDILAGLSDHMNYWKFGYNALMINDMAFIRNPNYHELSDTIETLDFEKMAQVVDACYFAITNLKS